MNSEDSVKPGSKADIRKTIKAVRNAMDRGDCAWRSELHGKKIPQEVQLVGFDDVGFGELFIPELTTIHQPIKEMGHLAAEIILKAVNGEPYEKKNVFDVKLIERETTKK